MDVKLVLLVLMGLTMVLHNPVAADYIWHNDEIPYARDAKCFRGHSYYTNNIGANNTDIDLGSEVESLLDYANDDTCLYCICSVSGDGVGCISRSVQYCNYFRLMRSESVQKDRYTTFFLQERPAHFRQLSWRIRRTMDNSIYEFLDHVNDDLQHDNKCVPFVSEYSNCNDDNKCSGCTQCSCTSEGRWSCKDVSKCEEDEQEETILEAQDEVFDNALKQLESDVKKKKVLHDMTSGISSTNRAPNPGETASENALLGDVIKEYKLKDVMAKLRYKRSSHKNNKHDKRSVDNVTNKHVKITTSDNNNTIHFYHTVDELNEDTLKSSNLSGTLLARKMDMKPQLSILRRSGDVGNSNKSLQIEFNQPRTLSQISDNKIDAADHETKFDASHEHLKALLSNHTQISKDKELSKVVVNELKNGSEVIGDSSAHVISNITFTPENDTLTAMAFIAGNLLNKLWNMEKDMKSSVETDLIKQEKISGLLDLFKEPLNLRQELFLRSALEKLSSAIDGNKDVKNISICENVQEVRKKLFNGSCANLEDISNVVTKSPVDLNVTKLTEDKKNMATVNAIAKINNVLELINKFETVQGNLSELKHGPKLKFNYSIPYSKKLVTDTVLTKEDKKSLNMFGNIIEKITRLLMPNGNNRKIVSQMQGQNILAENDNNIKNKFKKLYNIDISNMTVTAKDKFLLDYLTHIDRSPDCLLHKHNVKGSDSPPNIEGNILLNLSEFFKMKSISDLIKLLGADNPDSVHSPLTTTTTTTTTVSREKKIISEAKIGDLKNFNSTKEKLKTHLKSILEDLVELQNAKGISVKGDLSVADALPCIYNVLNAGIVKQSKTDETLKQSRKLEDIFSELKKEIKAAKTRRSNGVMADKSLKSAVVWDRVIKNLNRRSNSVSRRMLANKIPKSYAQIIEMMKKLDNNSASYKRYALIGETPPASKLVLLQALEQDVKNSMTLLEEIKLAINELNKLPSNKFKEIEEFVDNMAISMNVNNKVSKKLKQEPKNLFLNEINSVNKILTPKTNKKPMSRFGSQEGEEMKVSRVQVINQLIKNRMKSYITKRSDSGFETHNDMNYNIAKRVLYYLDTGNTDLATELFKMFMMQKHDNFGLTTVNDKYVSTPMPLISASPMRRMEVHDKKPLVQFEEPNKLAKQINWVNQDHLIKQLLNIKHMEV